MLEPDDGPRSNLDASAAASPSLFRSAWAGAKVGARYMVYVAVPFAYVGLVMALGLTLFGFGAGRGFGIPLDVFRGMAVVLVFVLYGGIFGGVVALIGWAIRRVPGLWARLDRPIRPRLGPRAAMVPEWLLDRWPLIVGVPTSLVFAGALGAGVFIGRFVDHRLAAALAAADRDEPDWRLDDLMAAREVVPDDQNAAILVADVAAMLPEGWPPDSPHPPGMPKPPRSKVWLAVGKLGDTPDNVCLEDKTFAAIGDALAADQEAVDLARRVADYPRGRHEVELSPNLLDTSLIESQHARGVARLLVSDAAIRSQRGDIDGALDSCRAALNVGRSIGDEPFLISTIVRAAIGGSAMQATRRALAQGEPSDAAAARLQEALLGELVEPLLLRGAKAERAILDEIIRRIADAEIPISSLSGGPSRAVAVPRISPWGKLAFDHQRAVGLELTQALVAIARQPIDRQPALILAWEAEILRIKDTRFGLLTATLPLLMMPALGSASQSHSRYRAELGAMAILLAAERYRRRRGAWPASVADIDPAILRAPPMDPFTGQPYPVLRDGGRYVVHSIGPNLVDEGGAYEARRWPTGGHDDVGAVGWDPALRHRPAAVED